MRYRPSAFSTVRFFKKPLGAGALVGFDFVTAWGGSASPVRTAALLFKRASHSFAGGVDRLEAVDRPAVQRHHRTAKTASDRDLAQRAPTRTDRDHAVGGGHDEHVAGLAHSRRQ